MRTITVITNNKTGRDRYFYDDADHMPIELSEDDYIKKYACLSDALKDSEPYRNEHYSDGECLDYVLGVIWQLERSEQ